MSYKLFSLIFLTSAVLISLTVSCDAQPRPAEDALRSLRDVTANGRLPAESVVADIERRFAGTETGALAKLLRARIRFENKDFRGAAEMLSGDEFARLTAVGDYALWLRGQALQNAGDHPAAMQAFDDLIRQFPDSLRASEARFMWASSAISSGRHASVPEALAQMVGDRSARAMLWTAKAHEASGEQATALRFYRNAYFTGAGTPASKEAGEKLTALGQPLTPTNAEEAEARAARLFALRNHADAITAYNELVTAFPAVATPAVQLNRLISAANAKRPNDAQTAFNAIPLSAEEKVQAFYELTTAYARNRAWPQARQTAEQMRERFPASALTPKAWVDAGYSARDARNKGEEVYFLRTALTAYPRAVEVAGAQFELAWLEHEAKNHARAADLLTEHLARYADKDSSNRGRAGYWAARNAERAGRIADACALYDALVYRYSANWYGHIGFERLTSLRGRGQCQSAPSFAADSMTPQAAANLRTIIVAPETAGPRELATAQKSDQLSTIGLFDWSIEELQDAQRTAQNSPKINLSLAKHHRMKGNNVAALLALAKSYPDYAQMFPEEMGRDEWDIFYPHIAWDQIKHWAKVRNLDIYQVAGLIRQESVFDARARSSANAYGLMQLLLPTARLVARKYGVAADLSSANALYQPALNIELGTGYMRDQLTRFGRVEFMAVAYNAGPGRVTTWSRTLPTEMDEYVEAIPFRETRGYVQGIIRNTAQYRRLYDEDGNFKPNVGTKPVRGAIDAADPQQLAQEFPDVVVDRSGE